MSAAGRSADGSLPSAPLEELLDSAQAGPTAIRGGALRIIGYAAGVLLTVASAALLFRHLGVDDGGRYVTVLALTSLVAGVTEIGLTTIGVRELAVRPGHEKRELMRDLLGLRLVLTTVGMAVAVAFAGLAGYGGGIVAGTLLAGIAVVATAVQSTLGISLMADLRLGWVTLIDLIRQVVFVIAIVALVTNGAGLVPILAAQIPAGLVALLMTVQLVRRSVPLVPLFDMRRWISLLRHVLPFAAATVVGALYFRAAMIVLSLVSTPAETGYFGASFRITEVLLVVPNLLVGAAFPIFARAARDDRKRFAYGVERVFQASVVFGVWLMVALLLGAPFAIAVVAGPEFGPSAGVLRLHSVALMLSFAATCFYYALLSLRRHREILVLASTALIVNLVLVSVLGGPFGATGAALGTLAAELVSLIAAGAVLARVDRTTFPALDTLPRVAVAAALGMAVLLVPEVPSVVAAGTGIIVFAAAALALRLVPVELIDALRSRPRRPSVTEHHQGDAGTPPGSP